MAPVSSPQPSTPVLQARDLSKSFGSEGGWFEKRNAIHAVRNVDLDLYEGDLLSLVGESGSGKSTLGRMLIGLMEPSSGTVLYEGRRLDSYTGKDALHLRRDLQIVFQDPYSSLNPAMRAGAIIAEPLRLHGIVPLAVIKEKVGECLEVVGLPRSAATRFPHEFSGGQRQRVAIARALASKPRVLIGDEPISALDVSIQAQIVGLLSELRRRLNLTLVIVAHDLSMVRHMGGLVAVMYRGRIVEQGEAVDVFMSPRHPYTAALLEATPMPIARRRERKATATEHSSPNSGSAGCDFVSRCPFAVTMCLEAVPPLVEPTPGRSVRCHRWPEDPVGRSRGETDLPVPGKRLVDRLELYRRWSARRAAGAGNLTPTIREER